jgi:hypothetical protein
VENEVLLNGLNNVISDLGQVKQSQIKLAVGELTKKVAERAKVVPREVHRFSTRTLLLNQEQRVRFSKEEIGPTSHHKYRIVKTAIAGGNWLELIDKSQKVDVGVTNFEGRKMDDLEVGLIDRIGLSFAIDMTNAVTDGYKLNFTNWGIAWDDLANGEAQVKLGGKPVLDNYPLKNFVVTETGAAPCHMDARNYYVEIPVDNILWSDVTELEVNVRFGKNTVAPAGSAVWFRIDIIAGGLKA